MDLKIGDRKEWLSVLAKAPADDLAARWAATGLAPTHDVLRAPEIGAVMVRGRAGGHGAPFNLGEMTVTRASVRLSGARSAMAMSRDATRHTL